MLFAVFLVSYAIRLFGYGLPGLTAALVWKFCFIEADAGYCMIMVEDLLV
jgi:hypothetical protein